MRYKVKNGNRIFEFDGKHVSSSTSKHQKSLRWVEFDLYITVAGTYVLERVGRSDVYHHIDCPMVKRYKLRYSPEDSVTGEHIGCPECRPSDLDDIVLEKPRFYAYIAKSAEDLIDSLYMVDDRGNSYLTKVTERLIEQAASEDKRLENAYRIEYIQ